MPTSGATTPSAEQVPPEPVYSSDGRFWWDGQRWVPLVVPQPMSRRAPDITDGVAGRRALSTGSVISGDVKAFLLGFVVCLLVVITYGAIHEVLGI